MNEPTHQQIIDRIRTEADRRSKAGLVAYTKDRLPFAMAELAEMSEVGVFDFGYDFHLWFGMFARSGSAALFSMGDPIMAGGISGSHLARHVEEFYVGEGNCHYFPPYVMDRIFPENKEQKEKDKRFYWYGLHMAYLQWYLKRSFNDIHVFAPVSESLPLSQKAIAEGNETGEIFIHEMEKLLEEKSLFMFPKD